MIATRSKRGTAEVRGMAPAGAWFASVRVAVVTSSSARGMRLEARCLLISPKDLLQRCNDLPLGAVGTCAVDQDRNQILIGPCCVGQPLQRTRNGVRIAAFAHRPHGGHLPLLDLRRDDEG